MVDTLGTAAKDLFSTMTLHYSLIRSLIDWNPRDQIIRGLYLGLLPEESQISEKLSNSKEDILNHAFEINPTLPVKCVVSANKKEEVTNRRYYFVNTVTPEDWKSETDEETKDAGAEKKEEEDYFEHLLVDMEDFQAEVDNAKLIEIILKMDKHRKKGHAVVVHCKAGRARSAMVCLSYLVTCVTNPETGANYTFIEALALLRAARPQVKLDDQILAKAKDVIKDFFIRFPKEEKETKESKPVFEVELADFLASKPFKNQILKLKSLNNLKQYAEKTRSDHSFKTSNRETIINNLIEMINRPNSEAWFFSLFSPTGKLALLKGAMPDKPSTELLRDQKERAQLAQAVKEEVFQFVANQFRFLGKKAEDLLSIATQIAERGRDSKPKEKDEVEITIAPSATPQIESLVDSSFRMYGKSCALEEASRRERVEAKSPRLGSAEA